jgi:hypothetical protein
MFLLSKLLKVASQIKREVTHVLSAGYADRMKGAEELGNSMFKENGKS